MSSLENQAPAIGHIGLSSWIKECGEANSKSQELMLHYHFSILST